MASFENLVNNTTLPKAVSAMLAQVACSEGCAPLSVRTLTVRVMLMLLTYCAASCIAKYTCPAKSITSTQCECLSQAWSSNSIATQRSTLHDCVQRGVLLPIAPFLIGLDRIQLALSAQCLRYVLQCNKLEMSLEPLKMRLAVASFLTKQELDHLRSVSHILLQRLELHAQLMACHMWVQPGESGALVMSKIHPAHVKSIFVQSPDDPIRTLNAIAGWLLAFHRGLNELRVEIAAADLEVDIIDFMVEFIAAVDFLCLALRHCNVQRVSLIFSDVFEDFDKAASHLHMAWKHNQALHDLQLCSRNKCLDLKRCIHVG